MEPVFPPVHCPLSRSRGVSYQPARCLLSSTSGSRHDPSFTPFQRGPESSRQVHNLLFALSSLEWRQTRSAFPQVSLHFSAVRSRRRIDSVGLTICELCLLKHGPESPQKTRRRTYELQAVSAVPSPSFRGNCTALTHRVSVQLCLSGLVPFKSSSLLSCSSFHCSQETNDLVLRARRPRVGVGRSDAAHEIHQR
jgi:hypothetical protein